MHTSLVNHVSPSSTLSYRNECVIHHMSSAGDGNRHSDDAANNRGLKNGAALCIATVFV